MKILIAKCNKNMYVTAQNSPWWVEPVLHLPNFSVQIKKIIWLIFKIKQFTYISLTVQLTFIQQKTLSLPFFMEKTIFPLFFIFISRISMLYDLKLQSWDTKKYL